MGKLVTEFIGTSFLTLVVLLGGGPMAVGAVLTATVYMGRHRSGAHYNPAVTLGFVARRRLDAATAVRYVAAQFAGAMFAAGIAWCLLNKTNIVAPAAGAQSHQWYLAEIVFSFALCLVYFHVTDSERTRDNPFYGLAIGFMAAAGTFAVGRISGAAFNPALGLGPSIVALLHDTAVPSGAWLLYLVAPCIGSLLAVLAYTAQTGR